MKITFLSIFLAFIPLNAFAQMAVFGDIQLHNQVVVAIHETSLSFEGGKIHTHKNEPGALHFTSNSHSEIPTHSSHADSYVFSAGHTDFTFPVGNEGIYQPLSIRSGNVANLRVRFLNDPHPEIRLLENVDAISNQFYWEVNGDQNATLGLSWNSVSGIENITSSESSLIILGYTGSEWEVIPASLAPFSADEITPTSLSSGRIYSENPIDFSRFTAFTLGARNKAESVLVSEGITPNGDNINDTWYIEGIEAYPNAVINVYNRWGGEVYHSNGNYLNDWDATYKNNSKRLPEASYYYRKSRGSFFQLVDVLALWVLHRHNIGL